MNTKQTSQTPGTPRDAAQRFLLDLLYFDLVPKPEHRVAPNDDVGTNPF